MAGHQERFGDATTVDVRAVLGSEITNEQYSFRFLDLTMAAADVRIVQPHLHITTTTDRRRQRVQDDLFLLGVNTHVDESDVHLGPPLQPLAFPPCF